MYDDEDGYEDQDDDDYPEEEEVPEEFLLPELESLENEFALQYPSLDAPEEEVIEPIEPEPAFRRKRLRR
jgi:hypothetical protein